MPMQTAYWFQSKSLIETRINTWIDIQPPALNVTAGDVYREHADVCASGVGAKGVWICGSLPSQGSHAHAE